MPEPLIEPVQFQVPEERPPAPTRWPFDVEKLMRIRSKADQLSLLRRDAADQVRECRAELQRLRAGIMQDELSHFGRANAGSYERRDYLEIELRRLLAEEQELEAKATPAIALAAKCSDWARVAHGWRADGRRPGSTGDLPPGIIGAEV